MDNKVKITLVTTGALLVLIIASGLYSTFNPKSIEIKTEQVGNQEQTAVQAVRVGLGEKSKMQIKTNSYYFPNKPKTRVKINPNTDIDEVNPQIFEYGKPKPMKGMESYIDPDYVPLVDEELMSTENEMAQQFQDQEEEF